MDSADGGAYPDLEDTVVSQVTRMIGEGIGNLRDNSVSVATAANKPNTTSRVCIMQPELYCWSA